MKTDVLGGEHPTHAVVACVHGEESCGWRAIQKFKQSDHSLNQPVKFILANERAFKQGQRFIDVDMNRVFPGDPDSENHEERIAYKLESELEGLKALDIHSTVSEEAPFAFTTSFENSELDLARSTGLDKVVDMGYAGGMSPEINSVSVELSRTKGNADQKAYEILLNFLRCEGLVEGSGETEDPEVFEVYEVEQGEGYSFEAQNFERVEPGEVYAEKPGDRRKAEEPFYPVLMSTDGYDEIIGFRARKIHPEQDL
jgi:predicted deacylase